MVSPSLVPDPLLDLRLSLYFRPRQLLRDGSDERLGRCHRLARELDALVRRLQILVAADGIAPEVDLGHVARVARRQVDRASAVAALLFEDEQCTVVRIDGCAVRPAGVVASEGPSDASLDKIGGGRIGDAA